MEEKQITAVIVGAGHRGILYASYALAQPDRLKIVGVVDPNPHRRAAAVEKFGIGRANCFSSLEQFLKKDRFADAVINATMDQLHVETAIPLIEKGYHMLLEKPVSTEKESLLELAECVEQNKSIVMVCHVLRYAPFYQGIKQAVLDGKIGEILSIHSAERVSYHHTSASYVRGKWNKKEECGSSMLMAKCCHDLDIITWLKSGVAPERVGSFGGILQYRPDKAPAGAGTRCLVDCPIEADCLYSAKKLYIDHPDRWSFYVWTCLEGLENPTVEDKINSLKTDNPHGRCIYRCGNTVVDNQSVMVQFADGSAATHQLITGAARPGRSIHVVGTKGEIEGFLEDGTFTIRYIDSAPDSGYREEEISVCVTGDAHGGGDYRLVDDFVKILRGEAPSVSTTYMADSVNGHLIGFAADAAREQNRIVEF